ncbi:MAG: hypothetical protein IIY87_00785 [Bacteroidales bacterium]|nr:hypothetical protein [Bacteroidales bacterium]
MPSQSNVSEANVAATIYTKGITKQFSLDLAKDNAQYQPIDVKQFDRVHDRYLCIDWYAPRA